MIQEITKEELSHARQGACVVEFYTSTCPHCKELEKTLCALAGEERDARLFKMNIGEQAEVARDLKIRSVPTLIRFEDGEIADRMVGAGSKDEIKTRFLT